MDRNVLRVSSAAIGASETGEVTEPPAQEKLLKYFPAEALALYSGLEPLAGGIAKENDDVLRTLLWTALALAVTFCVLFLRQFWNIKRKGQLAISAGSLILYVAALGGPFATIDKYDPLMGVFAAVVATAFLIFVRTPATPDA